MLVRRSVLALSLALLATPAFAQGQPPVIFAAASLKTALDEVATLWAKETGLPAPRLAYAGSNALARQIEQGAPADLFLSADLDWMDALAAKNLIRPETRLNLLGNRLALIAPADSKAAITLQPGASLAPPRGRAARDREYRQRARREIRQSRFREARPLGGGEGSPRASRECARRLAAGGARRSASGRRLHHRCRRRPKVRVIATFPEASHPPILYPAAIVRDSKNPLGPRFLEFLRGPGARAVFERHGFTLPPSPRQGS